MGRSQRHMLVEQNTTIAGELYAEGEIAPALLMAAAEPPARGAKAADEIILPVGPPGGPLQGSTMTGAFPESAIPPEPPQPEVPILDHLEPAEAVLGDPDFTLHVFGDGFTEESVIVFAGQDEPIVFVSVNEITTIVKPSLGWGAVTVQVQVRNAGSEVSAELPFTFTEPVVQSEGRKRK